VAQQTTADVSVEELSVIMALNRFVHEIVFGFRSEYDEAMPSGDCVYQKSSRFVKYAMCSNRFYQKVSILDTVKP